MTNAASEINALHEGTWAGTLGLVVTSASRDEVTATVDVRSLHHQPQGIVHGGVYATIVESLASIGAALDARTRESNVVGLENQTSFVRAVRSGKLHARATPVTRGRRTQLWEVVVTNDEGAVAAKGSVRLLVLAPEAEVAGAKLGDESGG